MTPEQKGDELVNKFYNTGHHSNSVALRRLQAKQSAIIAVEEIIAYQSILLEEFGSDADGYTPQYWNKVLTHLKNKL